mmetsp:Transcript_75680/g.244888  ORF Transcript_75680/g.244888 Transcript_75680/m.244888 type:complete len:185 (-) Transcript_75680:69-623(-)
MPWGGAYTNKVQKEAFFEAKPDLKFVNALVLELKPMEFKSHKFGWQASKPNQKVTVQLSGGAVEAQVMLSCIAEIVGKTELTAKKFLEKSSPLDVSDLAGKAEAHEFQTQSWGWHAHEKRAVTVAGEELQVMVNFNAMFRGTKEKEAKKDGGQEGGQKAEAAEDPEDEAPLTELHPAKKAKVSD